MATPKILSRRCGLYWPGHDVHVIQGLKYRDPDHPLIPGRLTNVSDDGILTVEFDDGTRRYWHHDPRPFTIAAGRNDNQVALQAHWKLLGTRTKQGGYHPIYIAEPDDHRYCPDTPPTGTALELLESAGGFLVSTAELDPESSG